MTGSRFAEQLDAVSENIGDVPRHELSVLLRRAAVRIRFKPVVLDDATEEALAKFAAEFEMDRTDALSRIVQEALTAAGYPAFHEIDEDGEVGGSA